MCASRLDPDYFVRTVLSRFNVLDLLTFVPSDKRRRGFVALEPEHEAPMLEGALTLLCQILSIRTFLGTHKRIVEHLNNVLLSESHTHPRAGNAHTHTFTAYTHTHMQTHVLRFRHDRQ